MTEDYRAGAPRPDASAFFVARAAALPSGRNDLSGCRNTEHLLVFRQSFDKILHVVQLTLTVPLDCFLARLADQARNAVKLVE